MEIPIPELLLVTDFSPYLNQVFYIRFTDEIILPGELISVKEVEGHSPVGRKPFAIIFRTGQKTEYYSQAICILQHPVKGEILLFLVPLGLDEHGMRYEAIFS